MEVKTCGDVKVVNVQQRVDAGNAGQLEAEFTELLNAGAGKIVCNFSNNEYISSAGLRVFLSVLKSQKKNNGKIVLAAFRPYVREVFDMAGFSQLFSIYETEEEALTSLA